MKIPKTNFPTVFFAVLSFFFSLSVLLPEGSDAFSIKSINIKSKFGDSFLAEILVLNDGRSGLEVEIGSSSDYAKLSLDRKVIVGSLVVDKNFSATGPGKQLIRIFSRKPLFYPSFHLVIKATIEGSTIIESYFLAVNFQTNLSIGVVKPRGKKELEKPVLLLSSTPPVRVKEKKAPESKTYLQAPEALKEPKRKIAEVKPEPLPAEMEKAPEKEPEVKLAEVKPPPQPKPKPAPVPEKRTLPSEKTKQKTRKKQVTAPQKTGSLTITTKWGDTLFKVANRVLRNKKDLNKAVAALWILNKEKFLQGNMNRLEEGIELDYTGLEIKMAEISRREARRIIKNQWNEFRFVKSLMVKDIGKEMEMPLNEVLLPGENIPVKDEILKRVDKWKRSWESEDLEGYINSYSSLFQARGDGGILSVDDWRVRKKEIFELQEGIAVSIRDIHIRRERDHFIVSFYQHYRSDKLDSFGLKTMDFHREQEEWRIFREGFSKRTPQIRKAERSFPYIVHVGVFKEREDALKQGNYLRRLGYSAYLVPMIVPGETVYFRVGVERFSSRKEAVVFASGLRGLRLSSGAVTLEAPYAIEIASYRSESGAFARMKELRAMGYSTYLLSLSSGTGGGMEHKILTGAYETLRQSEPVSSLLLKDGVEHQIVNP